MTFRNALLGDCNLDLMFPEVHFVGSQPLKYVAFMYNPRLVHWEYATYEVKAIGLIFPRSEVSTFLWIKISLA